jgi:hypothetical protein
MSSVKSQSNLPVFNIFSGKNDNVVGWAEKIGVLKKFNENHIPFFFFWDSRSHSASSTMEFQPEEKYEKLKMFSLNRSYPTFSNCSANLNPGDGNANSGDKYGTINGFLTWDEDITDEADYYEINLRSVSLNTIHGTIKPPDSIYSDVTLRRLQQFKVSNKFSYYYQNIGKYGTILQDGYIEVDKLGLLTFRKILITNNGNKLVIIRFDKE